jgi:hypothetical protein
MKLARIKMNPGSKRHRNKGVKTKVKVAAHKDYKMKKVGVKVKNFAGQTIGHTVPANARPGLEGTIWKDFIRLTPEVAKSLEEQQLYGAEVPKPKKGKKKQAVEAA